MLFSDILVNKEYRQALFDKIECPLIYLSNGFIQEINSAAKRLLHFHAPKDYQVSFHEFCQTRNYSLINILEKNYENQGIFEETYHVKYKPHFIRWRLIQFSDLNSNWDGQLIIGHDCTNEQSILNSMRKTELFYINILSKLPTYVYWKDRSGTYQGCNDLLAEVMGLPSREAIKGMTDFDFDWGKKGAAESFIAFDEKVMRTGRSLTTEDVFKIADGSCVTVLTNKTPLKDEKGKISGILAISVNITDKKKAELELIKAKEQAEMAAKAKSEFIANMSHDIRTPLNGVIGVAELLRNTAGSKQDQDFGEMIYVAGQRLLELLNGVLDVVKADHVNENDIYNETFNLHDMLRNLCGLMQASTKTRGLELNLEIDPQIPQFVESDQLKIQRILQNLMGNAIKFTHQGHVDLRAELLSKDEKSVHIRFCVLDTGIGIPKDQQAHVFERFFRATPSYQGVYQGHGIGLYIVQKFIDLLGGKIELESEVGKGTQMCFSLELKIGKAKDVKKISENSQPKIAQNVKIQQPQAKEEIAKNEPLANALRILFIEDNAIALKAGQILLRNAGFAVQLAESAETAIGLFKNQSFDLVISDLGLPGIQGDEMTSMLRYWEKIYQKKPTPIVALTAHAGDQVKNNCLLAGMNAVFMKPLDGNLLGEMLKWVEKDKNTSDSKDAKPLSEATTGLGRDLPATEAELFELNDHPIFDEAEGLQKTEGKMEFLREALSMQLELIPPEIVNMEEAHLVGDWEKLQKVAHKLKGGSLYCGTIKMTLACQYLERYWKAGHRKLLEQLYQQALAVIEETQQAIRSWLENASTRKSKNSH